MIALLLQTALPAPAAPPVAPWSPVERSPVPGIRSVSASATATDGARLVVRCDRGTDAVVSIQFIARTPPRRFAMQPVSLQFDGGVAMVDNWEPMGAGLIERVDAAVTTLSVGIAHARQIRLHSADASGAPVDLVFTGPGSEAPIRRVVEACGFSFGQVPQRQPAPRPEPAPSP